MLALPAVWEAAMRAEVTRVAPLVAAVWAVMAWADVWAEAVWAEEAVWVADSMGGGGANGGGEGGGGGRKSGSGLALEQHPV
jgi:uncharacterized membrane protein YgcG